MTGLDRPLHEARELLEGLSRARQTLDVLALELAYKRLREMGAKVDDLRVPDQVAQEIRQATAEAAAAVERVLKALNVPTEPPPAALPEGEPS